VIKARERDEGLAPHGAETGPVVHVAALGNRMRRAIADRFALECHTREAPKSSDYLSRSITGSAKRFADPKIKPLPPLTPWLEIPSRPPPGIQRLHPCHP
jgi:hypothetical protein